MRKKLKQINKKMKTILSNIVEDFFILVGLFLIVFATYLINHVASIYALGIVFLILGVYFSYNPPNRKDKGR